MDISGPFTIVIFNYFLLKFVYYNWFQTFSITVFLVYKFQTPGSSPCFSTGTDEERNEELALIIQAKEPRLLWEHGKKQNFVWIISRQLSENFLLIFPVWTWLFRLMWSDLFPCDSEPHRTWQAKKYKERKKRKGESGGWKEMGGTWEGLIK